MIVAGIGYRSAATVADLQEALALTGVQPQALASVTAKARGQLLMELAEDLGIPIIAIEEDRLSGQATPTDSTRINARFGTGSLAEAVALLAARQNAPAAEARILVPRVQTENGMATAAIAERITP